MECPPDGITDFRGVAGALLPVGPMGRCSSITWANCPRMKSSVADIVPLRAMSLGTIVRELIVMTKYVKIVRSNEWQTWSSTQAWITAHRARGNHKTRVVCQG